jgi:hypothetical protein
MTVTGAVLIVLIVGAMAWLVLFGERADRPGTPGTPPDCVPPSQRASVAPVIAGVQPVRRPTVPHRSACRSQSTPTGKDIS